MEDLLHPAVRGSLFILVATVSTSLYGLLADSRIVEALLLHPWSVWRRRRLATVVTSGFVHADLAHLAFNMVTFYYFAPPLEVALGTGGFLFLYGVSLAASDITTIWRRRDDPAYRCLGASGAVTAVVFGFILYWPDAAIYFLFLPVPIPAPFYALGFLVLSAYAARRAEGRVNHAAHAWGGVSGLVAVALLDPSAYPAFWQAVRERYFG